MIIIAPDKFKGSLSSVEVCNIIENGIHDILPYVEIKKFPFSDGGNGFLDTIDFYMPGLKKKELVIFDPLLKAEIKTKYLTGKTSAYIETAESSGLHLLDFNDRNPMNTSTYGLGQIIKDAVLCGYTDIYVGLGGSSTNDGGIGLANALGWKFYNKLGKELIPTGRNLLEIETIQTSHFNIDANIYGLSDVQNCLYGSKGAARVFAAQKGASVGESKFLDAGLKHLAIIIKKQYSLDINSVSGSGAAGGTSAGLYAFTNAKIIDGANFIIDISNIKQYFDKCKLMITGEGKMDKQTLMGKVCYKLTNAANVHGIPVVGIVGKNTLKKKLYVASGFNHVYQLNNKKISDSESFEQARELLLKTSRELAMTLLKERLIV